MGVLSLMNRSKESFLATIALLQAFVAKEATLQSGDGLITRAQNAGTVIAVVVIGIVAMVGLLIFGEVWNAMPMTENDTLYTEAEGILEGFGDAMGLVPIILLVLLATVVIGVVQRMRQ